VRDHPAPQVQAALFSYDRKAQERDQRHLEMQERIDEMLRRPYAEPDVVVRTSADFPKLFAQREARGAKAKGRKRKLAEDLAAIRRRRQHYVQEMEPEEFAAFQADVYLQNSAEIERLGRMIALATSRREKLLADLERRSEAFARTLRATSDQIIDAEFSEAPLTEGSDAHDDKEEDRGQSSERPAKHWAKKQGEERERHRTRSSTASRKTPQRIRGCAAKQKPSEPRSQVTLNTRAVTSLRQWLRRR
jgi:hypothetical protein